MDEETKKEFEKVWAAIEELKRIKLYTRWENLSIDSKKISIKEFLIEKKPGKDFHKTLAICYYLEKHKGMNKFNAKDIEEVFREAKEIVPKNINYKVIQNIQIGYIMEAKEKKDGFKSWTLTNTGEKFVESGFSR